MKFGHKKCQPRFETPSTKPETRIKGQSCVCVKLISMTLSNKEKNLIDLCAQGKTSHYSDCDLTMKFWRLMGFITTGGPAVRGHAWNFLSVSSHHPLFETVPGVVPPNIFLSEMVVSHIYATPKLATIDPMMYFPAILQMNWRTQSEIQMGRRFLSNNLFPFARSINTSSRSSILFDLLSVLIYGIGLVTLLCMKAQINCYFWVSLRINTTKPWNAALVLLIKEGGAPRTCSQINEVEVEVEVEELIAFWNQSRLYRILIHATFPGSGSLSWCTMYWMSK